MEFHDEGKCVQHTGPQRADRIRELNDQFRRDRKGGYYRLTCAVGALGYETCVDLLQAIAEFADFTPDNDPFGEHDFGALTFRGERYFWKIDYYDRRQTYASPDPADPVVTLRILTVMLASEY